MALLKYLAENGILAILLMFAGWLFVFKNSRALAKQSEINSLAAAMEKTLQEIADENYKFWKDIEDLVDFSDSEELNKHIAKTKIFSSYIDHRCNIVEKKIHSIFKKSSKCLNPEVESINFIEVSILLIAKIRDRATFDSERPTLVKDKYQRITSINSLTLKLSNHIHNLVYVRFKPINEWKWPENY